MGSLIIISPEIARRAFVRGAEVLLGAACVEVGAGAILIRAQELARISPVQVVWWTLVRGARALFRATMLVIQVAAARRVFAMQLLGI